MDKDTKKQEVSTARDGETAPSSSLYPVSSLTDNNQALEVNCPMTGEVDQRYARDYRFWCIMVSLCTMMILASLENTVIVTSLPAIVEELGVGNNYVWVGNIFFLTNCAVQPLFGQLCNLFGRRHLALFIVAIYTLGSGIAGGSTWTSMLLAGRAVQGAGSGGITMIETLIIADLVPLRDRGNFQAILAMTYAIGMAAGPIIGGVIMQNTLWRWVFYINLPFGGLCLALLWLFLRVKWDKETRPWKKLKRIDVAGNSLIVASSVSVLLALTWAGAYYPWSSPRVLVPLIIGLVGFCGLFWLESSDVMVEPVMPLRLFANRTSGIIFINTFLVSTLSYWIFFLLPIYFQSVQLSSPARSGVQILPVTLIAVPGAAVGAVVLSKWGKNKILHIIGFAFLAGGMGSLSVLDRNSSTAEWVCLQILPSVGAGMVLDTLLPPFQAGVAESDAAAATASWTFIRSFGNIWGVAIPAAIFNTYTNQYDGGILDSTAREHLQHGDSYTWATKAFIERFPDSVRIQIIEVFSGALSRIFLAASAFAGVPFILRFVEREVHLRTELETEFGLEEKKEDRV